MHWVMRFYDHRPFDRAFAEEIIGFLSNRGMRVDRCTDDVHSEDGAVGGSDNSGQDQLDEQLQKRLDDFFTSLYRNVVVSAYLDYGSEADGLRFGMWIYLDPEINSCTLNLENCTVGAVEEDTLLSFFDLCKELFTRYDFRYAAVTDEWDNVYFDRDGIPTDTPGILDLYSRALVDQMGRERLESMPARTVEQLDNRGLMRFLSAENPAFELRYGQVLGRLEKNIDYVAEASDPYVWTYSLPEKEVKISEASDRLLKIGREIIDLAEGFFIPDEADYSISIYDTDYRVADIGYRSMVPYIATLHQNYKIDKSSDALDLFKGYECVDTPANVVKYVRRIEMTGKTLFTLKCGDILVDTGSPTEVYAHDNGWISDSTLWEPFSIDIGCSESPVDDQNKHPGALFYYIGLKTGTYIWFDDTDIGKENDKRLKNFQKKLHKKFKIVAEEQYRC